eukprot:TRINITY_DN20567_c0_g2_i5.p1 TRINITY_DN20567_c0_g2~~TRINITY_DN20567_c0_g2_i5.p1  ORF type:complete len:610 (-),score=170.25 TRINITY_DN20567_c0_g2_i5:592-2421(-)
MLGLPAASMFASCWHCALLTLVLLRVAAALGGKRSCRAPRQQPPPARPLHSVRIGDPEAAAKAAGDIAGLEVVRLADAPRLHQVKGLLTAEECHDVLQACNARWDKATTSGGAQGKAEDPVRKSFFTHINPEELPVIPSIKRIVDKVLAVAMLPFNNMEALQVTKYHEGDFYGFHRDAGPGLHRYATILVYLNDGIHDPLSESKPCTDDAATPVDYGGATAFPLAVRNNRDFSWTLASKAMREHEGARKKLAAVMQERARPTKKATLDALATFCDMQPGDTEKRVRERDDLIRVYPVQGEALFWYNYNMETELDPHSLHGACPVNHGGVKYIMQIWIRTHAWPGSPRSPLQIPSEDGLYHAFTMSGFSAKEIERVLAKMANPKAASRKAAKKTSTTPAPPVPSIEDLAEQEEPADLAEPPGRQVASESAESLAAEAASPGLQDAAFERRLQRARQKAAARAAEVTDDVVASQQARAVHQAAPGDAAELLRRAFQLNPTRKSHASNLGLSLMRMGKLHEAEAFMTVALELSSNEAERATPEENLQVVRRALKQHGGDIIFPEHVRQAWFSDMGDDSGEEEAGVMATTASGLEDYYDVDPPSGGGRLQEEL